MTIFIGQSLMNSVLTACRTCDDSFAILQKMVVEQGVQVVPDGDPRATDVAINFMYPRGARKVYDEQNEKKGSTNLFDLSEEDMTHMLEMKSNGASNTQIRAFLEERGVTGVKFQDDDVGKNSGIPPTA